MDLSGWSVSHEEACRYWKTPQKKAVAVESDEQGDITSSDYGGAGGGGGSRSISRGKVVTVVPVLWPEAGRCLNCFNSK